MGKKGDEHDEVELSFFEDDFDEETLKKVFVEGDQCIYCVFGFSNIFSFVVSTFAIVAWVLAYLEFAGTDSV